MYHIAYFTYRGVLSILIVFLVFMEYATKKCRHRMSTAVDIRCLHFWRVFIMVTAYFLKVERYFCEVIICFRIMPKSIDL